MASDTSPRDGSVEIQKLQLSSADGKRSISLIATTTSINIYEDLLSPVIYAEIQIQDSADLQSQFPLIGEEFVEISFRTAGFDSLQFNTYKLYLQSATQATTNLTGKYKTYTLKCCSEEYLRNASRVVTTKLQGTCEGIVSDMLRNTKYIGSKKNYHSEPSKGPQDVFPSRLAPFQVVDFVRRRAASQKYYSSSYVFFENKRGYNFCTVEYLFDQGKDKIGDKVFYYDSKPVTETAAIRYRNILGMKNVSTFDTASKLNSGGIQNTVRKFDILTGAITENNYVNIDQQDKFKSISDKNSSAGLNSTSFEKQYGDDKEGLSMLVPTSSEFPENYIADALGPKRAFVNKIIQNLFQIHVYGDSEITVGDVIKVNLPRMTGTTDQTQYNRLISGNYLVSKLRHIITFDKQRLYTCSMELIKGEYQEAI